MSLAGNQRRLAPSAIRPQLPAIPQRQLNLPRIEHGAWRAVAREGRALPVVRECPGTGRGKRGGVAEVHRTIDGVEVFYVCVVEEVKGLGDELHLLLLANGETPRSAEVEGVEVFAAKGVAAFETDSVVVVNNVAVGIEARKFRKELGGLQGDDGPQLEVAGPHAPRGRRGEDTVGHEAVADVVRRVGLLPSKLADFLTDHH